jgi:hypothetical protein
MTTYTKEQIREAVNLVIGDDGKRADEIIDVLELMSKLLHVIILDLNTIILEKQKHLGKIVE